MVKMVKRVEILPNVWKLALLEEFLNKLKDNNIGFLWIGLSFDEEEGRWVWLNNPKYTGHSENSARSQRMQLRGLHCMLIEINFVSENVFFGEERREEERRGEERRGEERRGEERRGEERRGEERRGEERRGEERRGEERRGEERRGEERRGEERHVPLKQKHCFFPLAQKDPCLHRLYMITS
ncbi:hypothetical protein Q9966_009981 [Columba livia]|nr:hypothetical protein Q9966_009981 [Columba livia]